MDEPEVPVATAEVVVVNKLPQLQWTPDQIELMKRTVARGATDDELALFLYQAKRMGLDPLSRQVHAIKRWDNSLRREVMSIQVGIDGFRLQAQRSGEYAGQDGPYWSADDGLWRDLWASQTPPFAARVGVYRKGFSAPLYRVALFKEYAQKTKEGALTRMWASMPAGQLAKCAEALALRAAFPTELGNVYVHEEMGHTDGLALYEGGPVEDRGVEEIVPACSHCGSTNVTPDNSGKWWRCLEKKCGKGTKIPPGAKPKSLDDLIKPEEAKAEPEAEDQPKEA